MLDIEAVREKYRPPIIATLFVGESAPHSGKFFYCGENTMLREMRFVLESWIGEPFSGSQAFLDAFKARGWYLDDLVLTPVNHLLRTDRKAQCRLAEKSLANRLRLYNPKAIVMLLVSIEPFVARAALDAGCPAPQYVVPFPGMGQQNRFRSRMAAIIGKLPTNQQFSD